MPTNDNASTNPTPSSRKLREPQIPTQRSAHRPPAFLSETMKLPDLAKRYGVSLPTVYKWIEGAEDSIRRCRQ